MNTNRPSPAFQRRIRTAAKIIIIGELVTIGGGLLFHHQLNNNPKFSEYINREYPKVVKTWYDAGNFYYSVFPFEVPDSEASPQQNDKKD